MRRLQAAAGLGAAAALSLAAALLSAGGCTTIYNYENYYVADGGAPDSGGEGGAGGGAVAVATQLHPGIVSPVKIAVDDSYVYWSDGELGIPQSGVHRVGKDGKGYKMLTLAENPSSIAVDETHVYFVDEPLNGKSLLKKVSKEGGEAQVIVQSFQYTCGITLHDKHVYFSATDTIIPSGRIARISKDLAMNEMPQELVTGQNLPCELVVDSTGIYWVEMGISEPGAIMTAGLDGMNAKPIVLGQKDARDLAISGANVYWNTISCKLLRAKTDGTDQVTLQPKEDTNDCGDIAVDGTRIYWAQHESLLGRLVPNGDELTTLATVESRTGGVVTDDTHVFFSRSGDLRDDVGGIYSIAKP